MTTPVTGLVLRVGRNRLGGNVVTVLGPAFQVHYFAHLDRFGGFRAGDIVRAGDVLGYVGDSGNAKGGPPHLHYAIHARGQAINPYPMLTQGRAELSEADSVGYVRARSVERGEVVGIRPAPQRTASIPVASAANHTFVADGPILGRSLDIVPGERSARVVSGCHRGITDDDVGLLVPWIADFFLQTGDVHSNPAEYRAQRRAGFRVWDDDGPVSMAAALLGA